MLSYKKGSISVVNHDGQRMAPHGGCSVGDLNAQLPRTNNRMGNRSHDASSMSRSSDTYHMKSCDDTKFPSPSPIRQPQDNHDPYSEQAQHASRSSPSTSLFSQPPPNRAPPKIPNKQGCEVAHDSGKGAGGESARDQSDGNQRGGDYNSVHKTKVDSCENQKHGAKLMQGKEEVAGTTCPSSLYTAHAHALSLINKPRVAAHANAQENFVELEKELSLRSGEDARTGSRYRRGAEQVSGKFSHGGDASANSDDCSHEAAPGDLHIHFHANAQDGKKEVGADMRASENCVVPKTAPANIHDRLSGDAPIQDILAKTTSERSEVPELIGSQAHGSPHKIGGLGGSEKDDFVSDLDATWEA
jgi:hypothetical protein